jgi:hypothetical protein
LGGFEIKKDERRFSFLVFLFHGFSCDGLDVALVAFPLDVQFASRAVEKPALVILIPTTANECSAFRAPFDPIANALDLTENIL